MPFGVNGLPSRVCVVKYAKSSSSVVALHLTGTVFLDKTLMVVPCSLDEIPDDEQIVWDAVCAGVKTLVTRPTPSQQSETASESDKENGPATAATTPDTNADEMEDHTGSHATPIPTETSHTGSCDVENEEMIFNVEAEDTVPLTSTDYCDLADTDDDFIDKDLEEQSLDE